MGVERWPHGPNRSLRYLGRQRGTLLRRSNQAISNGHPIIEFWEGRWEVAEQHTTAEEMARKAGVMGKSFRARLRRNLAKDHTHGSWRVLIGSSKHIRMQNELESMIRDMRSSRGG